MPVFQYEAFDSGGRRVTGAMHASDEAAARARIRDQGFFPTDLQAKEDSGGALFGRGVSDRELAATTRLLGTLLGAGFSVVDALGTLVNQSSNPRVRQVLADVRARVQEGGKLSDGLEAHDDVFPNLYVQMVRAGEAGAALEAVLSELADYLEVRSRVKDKFTAAVAYPAVMTVVGVVMLGFLVAWVVPTMADLLRSGGRELPLITRVLMALGDLLLNGWWALAILAVLAVVGARAALATEGGRAFWDHWVLRVPAVGDLLMKISMARFARLFSVLLKAGVPILQALAIVKEVVGNVHIAAALDLARQEVSRGAALADPLRRSGLFPPLVTDMVDAGQRAGRLTETLDRLSEGYDQEVSAAIETVIALLEPVLIVVMAVGVAFVVAGVLLPIFELNNMRGF